MTKLALPSVNKAGSLLDRHGHVHVAAADPSGHLLDELGQVEVSWRPGAGRVEACASVALGVVLLTGSLL